MHRTRKLTAVLVAGSLAAAAVSALTGAPPLLSGLAAGVALVGALVHRLHARRSAAQRGRRPVSPLDARLAAITEELASYERGLAELVHAHERAEATAAVQLAALQERLARLEAINADQRGTLESLRQSHARELGRLEWIVGRQRDALAGVERALRDVAEDSAA